MIQEMGIFPMSVANNFCDMPLPKYLDSKTVLIYRPHPVHKFTELPRLLVFFSVTEIYLQCFTQLYREPSRAAAHKI